MADYTTLFREAVEYGRRRDYTEAISRLRYIVSATDDIEEAYLYLGRSYHALGAYPQAVDMLRRFVYLKPDSAAGWFFLGRTLISAKEYRRAGEALYKALELRPELLYAKSFLGYAYLKTGKTSEAVRLLGEAVQEDPENRTLYTGYINALLVEGIRKFKSGLYDDAEEIFLFISSSEVIHSPGEGGILPHLYLGMIHRLKGEFDRALEDYRRALAYSPNDELITYRIAMLLQKTGKREESDGLFRRLYHKSSKEKVHAPSDTEADRHLAIKYFERKNYPQALHHALQVLHKRHKDTEMHLIAGECYRETGDFEVAQNHFTRIFDTDKQHLGGHYGLALVYWQCDEYEQMLDRLRKIERLDPGNETVHYYTVLCNWKMDTDPQKLLPVVQEAVRRFGPETGLLHALADTYERIGYPDLADKWYRKILGIDDTYIDAYRGIIDIFNKYGDSIDIEEGYIEKIFDRYLELSPADRKSRRIYIQHLYKRGKYRETLGKIEEYLSSRRGGDDRGDVYFERMRAICYRKTGQYEIASELYRRLLREEPYKEEFLRSYVFCLEKSNKLDLAAETVERAVEYLDSPGATLCLIAGVLRFKEKKMEKALALFRRASDMDPQDWRGYYNIGEIYRRQGMEEFARRFLQRAESLKKNNILDS
ncbi:MAG: tetratricopeptide repeat protein [Spirochaetaceae bacterium]